MFINLTCGINFVSFSICILLSAHFINAIEYSHDAVHLVVIIHIVCNIYSESFICSTVEMTIQWSELECKSFTFGTEYHLTEYHCTDSRLWMYFFLSRKTFVRVRMKVSVLQITNMTFQYLPQFLSLGKLAGKLTNICFLLSMSQRKTNAFKCLCSFGGLVLLLVGDWSTGLAWVGWNS